MVGVGAGLLFDPGPSNPAYGSGANELAVQKAIASHLRPGSVFYDVGANVGFFATIAARLVGTEGRVFAFEPVAANADQIHRNARLNRFENIAVVQRAVAAASGRSEFWNAEYSGGGALTSAPKPPDATSMLRVDVVALDDFVYGEKSPPPDVVKVDVEGAELEVLNGMERLLSERRPVVVYEVDDQTAGGVELKRQAIERFLLKREYRVEPLEDSYGDGPWHVAHGVAMPAASGDVVSS